MYRVFPVEVGYTIGLFYIIKVSFQKDVIKLILDALLQDIYLLVRKQSVVNGFLYAKASSKIILYILFCILNRFYSDFKSQLLSLSFQ